MAPTLAGLLTSAAAALCYGLYVECLDERQIIQEMEAEQQEPPSRIIVRTTSLGTMSSIGLGSLSPEKSKQALQGRGTPLRRREASHQSCDKSTRISPSTHL